MAQVSHVVPVGRPWGSIAGTVGSAPRRKKLERRRGLIFDLDDTLYPRERFIRSGFAAVANDLQRRHGLPAGMVFRMLSQAFTGGQAGREFQVLCDELGLPPKEVSYMLRVFRAHKPSLWLPYESSETLRKLRLDGWRLAILTNGIPAVQAAKVDALALAPMVDTIVYAEAIARGGKPAPAVFYETLDRLDLTADRCAVVGDDPVCDIAGAHAAEMRSIRVARPGVVVDPASDADLIVNSITDVPKVAGALLQMVTLDAA